MRQNAEELLTTPSPEDVDIAQARRKLAGDPLENDVANLVAMRVIDQLEMIDIETDDGEAGLVAGQRPRVALEFFDQMPAVEQTGQRVVTGEHRQAFVGGLQALAQAKLTFSTGARFGERRLALKALFKGAAGDAVGRACRCDQ